QDYLSVEDVKDIYLTIDGSKHNIAAITDEAYFCNYDAEKFWGKITNIIRTDFLNLPTAVPKLTLFFPNLDAHLCKEIDKLKADYLIQIMDNNATITISKLDATKGEAINFLRQKHNINVSDCIAIGNDLNDISAFQTCGLSVAVSNAESEVRDIAKIIIESNNDKGVEKFILKLLSKNE
ncbi:MAG: Cof-type HAD-IIB family hydrolase, partial [Clostridia bacterium]|nr:Cof-type HAD-IIB family hydrolase [Clostridia bacterium]